MMPPLMHHSRTRRRVSHQMIMEMKSTPNLEWNWTNTMRQSELLAIIRVRLFAHTFYFIFLQRRVTMRTHHIHTHNTYFFHQFFFVVVVAHPTGFRVPETYDCLDTLSDVKKWVEAPVQLQLALIAFYFFAILFRWPSWVCLHSCLSLSLCACVYNLTTYLSLLPPDLLSLIDDYICSLYYSSYVRDVYDECSSLRYPSSSGASATTAASDSSSIASRRTRTSRASLASGSPTAPSAIGSRGISVP